MEILDVKLCMLALVSLNVLANSIVRACPKSGIIYFP